MILRSIGNLAILCVVDVVAAAVALLLESGAGEVTSGRASSQQKGGEQEKGKGETRRHASCLNWNVTKRKQSQDARPVGVPVFIQSRKTKVQ